MDIPITIAFLKNLAILTVFSCGLLIGGFLAIRLVMFIVEKFNNRWKALYATIAPVKEGKENGQGKDDYPWVLYHVKNGSSVRSSRS